MHASFLSEPGGPLEFGQLPDPMLSEDTARIAVQYCGVNHLDILIRQGKRPGIPSYPHVLGSEVVGTVEEIRSGTRTVAVGDTVAVYPWTFCGTCTQCETGNEQICDTMGTLGRTSWGGYAERIVVPIHNLLPIPAHLDPTDICALILAGTTAEHLVERSDVQNGQTVLVTGGSGGVGVLVIQLLRARDCTVIAATSHPEKSQHLKQIGAHYVIPITDMETTVHAVSPGGADRVIDIVGGAVWSEAVKALRKNGTMAFCSTSQDEPGVVPVGTAFSKQWNILGSYGGNREHLRRILRSYEDGLVKPVIHMIIPLADARQAHEIIESQSAFGKILLKL